MKKIYILLLLFTGLTYAQPPIHNPSPMERCDVDNDGTELFYLGFMNNQILGSLNPNDYSFEYYADAATTIQITSPYLTASTVVYAKVIENANPSNFAITSLSLVLNSSPLINVTVSQASCNAGSSVVFSGLPAGNWFIQQPNNDSPFYGTGSTYTLTDLNPGIYNYYILDSKNCVSPTTTVTISQQVGIPVVNQGTELHIAENPFDGFGSFNLTSQQSAIIGTQTGLNFIYYSTATDAQNGTNQIVNPTSYQNISNPQTIWVRAVNTVSNCYQIASFKIKVFDSTTIVNIPDANFKARLLAANYTNRIAAIDGGTWGGYGQVDMNLDGEIQLTEAASVTELNVDSPSSPKISDLTGIETFTELWSLNCSYNLLTTLNVAPLVNTSLGSLNCSYNNLSTFDYNSLGNITHLNCSSNQLSTLSINNLTHLTSLVCSYNQLTNLDIQPFHLTYLDCRDNQIPTLNYSFPQEMTYLDISNNLITSLDLSLFSSNLGYLFCQGNTIDTLDLTNPYLWKLTCGPVLHPINVENQTNLRYFLFSDTEQGSLNLLNNPLLDTVFFHNINVTSLDFSNCRNIQYGDVLDIIGSPNLEYLNLKMGVTWYGSPAAGTYPIQISGCPNLRFVCADEQNINGVNQALTNHANNPTAFVSSYCTYTPGGSYNTITGSMTFDANNNGCDVDDILHPNIRVNISNGTNTGASFTSNSGIYTFYTQAGSFNVTPAIENQTWFTFSPITATIPFANNNNNIATQNFCITANGVHPDVEVIVAPITRARPGFDAVYKVVYKNKGNQTLSGNVSFNYNDAVLDFVSSDVLPTSQSTGSLNYNYTNLLPFENRSFTITLLVNAPTDSPAVNIGDQLNFMATVNPIASDENPSDNTFQYNQTAVGSFDPNDITCIEGNVVPPAEIGNYLHYVINFENTGTADAENIVVRDVIDTTQFDLSSLQVLNSSAPVTAKLTGNIAEFIFQNISLHSGGHGNILIKVKSKNTLVQGDTVNKRANIYFDYNAPVDTNMENTTFQALNTPGHQVDNSITIYPNPTKGNVNISCNNTINSVQLYDVQGRLLQTSLVNESKTTIDISNQSSGVYFVKIISDKGIGVQKIVKE